MNREIPMYRKGKKLYFLRSEIIEWIKSGRIKTIAEIEQEEIKKVDSQVNLVSILPDWLH